jgi:GH35 family endo-1,4-beta-xylanase
MSSINAGHKAALVLLLSAAASWAGQAPAASTYEGREADAPWSKAADARIEKYRKGDLKVVVKDKNGKPVANADVTVKMRKHAYGFGTCVSGPVLNGQRVSAADVQKYKDTIVRLFNKAVMENDLKWPSWAQAERRPQTLEAVDWLRQAGISVRGHNLIWPSWKNTPRSLSALKNDPAALGKAIIAHIEEESTALHGRVVEWDVINEPFSNHDVLDILGKAAMVDWFKAARRGDPEAKLYINDFDILSGDHPDHQDDYYRNIKFLIDSGSPLDGIGLQSHFGKSDAVAPEEVYRRLNRFAHFKKALQITEFDFNTPDEQLQADYTRDFLTVAFSHPSTVGFLMWGFWERSHWRPGAAMFRADWSTKPNYDAYYDLVFKKWWTNAAGKTTPSGKYTVRGFLGDYDVEVRAGDRAKALKTKIVKGNTVLECVLD